MSKTINCLSYVSTAKIYIYIYIIDFKTALTKKINFVLLCLMQEV